MGVGVAADADQQRRVVDDRARLLVQADPLCQPQGDQALAQDVLHRLAEAEVDAQRERCHQLRQAHRLAVCLGRHAADSMAQLPRAASDARSVTCEAGGGVMCTGAPKCDSFMVMSIDDCDTGIGTDMCISRT